MGATVNPMLIPALLFFVGAVLSLATLVVLLAWLRQWRPGPPGDDEPWEPWEPDPDGISIPARSSYQLAA